MILNPTQRAIEQSVRAFAQTELAPHAQLHEAAGQYPPHLFEKAAELGLLGMTAAEQYGGSSVDFVSYALALIELAAGDGAFSTIVSIQNSLVVALIASAGSDEQKEAYLSDLIEGRAIGAFALTEADAGSDAAAITTRAERTQQGYVLNGAKQFISSGRTAKLVIVVAVTDPSKGRRGLTCFLAPTNSPGYFVDKTERKLGQCASDTCAIRFEGLHLDEGFRLGEEGQGYALALSNLEAGRIGIAAQSVGMAQAALQRAIAYAKERKSMGMAIIQHQAVGFRLADLAAQLEAARQLVLHAAALRDTGATCAKEAAMAKLVASETAERVVSGAIQTLGGYGYLEEFGLAKIYRDVRVCQIYEGTSDIQRMVISRSLQLQPD